MDIYNLKDIEKIYVFGGLNDRFTDITHRIMEEGFCNSVIIAIGNKNFTVYDFNTIKEKFEESNSYFASNNINLFIIRGNDLDPMIFENKLINFSNIKAISDYSIIKTKNKNILCIGGSISYNRDWKITYEELISKFNKEKSSLYFENECFNLDKNKINELKEIKDNIDYIVTQTAPFSVDNISYLSKIKFFKYNKVLLKDVIKEKKKIDSLFKTLKKNNTIKKWLYSENEYDIVTSYERVDFIPVMMDTFLDISKENKMKEKELLSFNDLFHELIS